MRATLTPSEVLTLEINGPAAVAGAITHRMRRVERVITRLQDLYRCHAIEWAPYHRATNALVLFSLDLETAAAEWWLEGRS